jgi:hypothetical protein
LTAHSTAIPRSGCRRGGEHSPPRPGGAVGTRRPVGAGGPGASSSSTARGCRSWSTHSPGQDDAGHRPVLRSRRQRPGFPLGRLTPGPPHRQRRLAGGQPRRPPCEGAEGLTPADRRRRDGPRPSRRPGRRRPRQHLHLTGPRPQTVCSSTRPCSRPPSVPPIVRGRHPPTPQGKRHASVRIVSAGQLCRSALRPRVRGPPRGRRPGPSCPGE